MERFEESSGKHSRDGVAKDRGQKTQCQKKLCLVSADKDLIYDLMYEASLANDCYKVEVRRDDRLGVYLGQSTFTNESSVGDAWAKYASHPKVWAFVQDVEFCDTFKGRIRNYE